jgi:hypothetical protein
VTDAGIANSQVSGGGSGGPGGVTDHGQLTGLGDDDHPQYITDAELAAAITAVEYLANSYNLVVGGFTNLTLTDSYTVNGISMQIDEVSGVPGFDFRFTFIGVTSFDRVRGHVWYDANFLTAHSVAVQIWNYVQGQWVALTSIQRTNDFIAFDVAKANHPIDPANGGTVIIRFYHAASGNTSHDFYVDYLALIKGGDPGQLDHGELAGLTDDDHPQYWTDKRNHAAMAAPGLDGLDGEDGVIGPPGLPGSQGIQGVQGNPGSPGSPGATGPAGAIGVPGIDGIDGERGDDGPPGSAGPRGLQGVQGATGVQGIPGPPGLDADDAEIPYLIPGPAGPQGLTGSTGPPGTGGGGGSSTPGMPGIDGEDAEIPYVIPGPQGPQGPQGQAGGGGGSATTVEVNLGSAACWRGKFTITDGAITAVKKILCWQAPGPYTGKGSLADEAEIAPVQVTAVAPAAGSAVVYWNSVIGYRPVFAGKGREGQFIPIAASMGPGNASPVPPLGIVGLVRGNVKFNYLVLA